MDRNLAFLRSPQEYMMKARWCMPFIKISRPQLLGAYFASPLETCSACRHILSQLDIESEIETALNLHINRLDLRAHYLIEMQDEDGS